MKKPALIFAFAAACLHSACFAQAGWVVGQSVPLTGSNARFGTDIRDGAQAVFKRVNRLGGVAGVPVELVTLDDQNQRKVAGENTTKLLKTKGLVALYGFASATLSLDAMPQAEQAGVLFFAPFSGANPVRKPSPVVYTLRASYGEELEKMLSFWTGLGAKRVAVVHYDDEVGLQNLALVSDFLAKQGKQPLSLPLKRNTAVDASKFQQLVDLKPDVIVNTVLSAAAAEISKQLVERNKFVPMSSLSFVGAQQYIDAAGTAAAGVSIAQVVPNPGAPLPVVRDCAEALRESGITSPMNSTHLEACLGAKVLLEAMRRSKSPGDPKALLNAFAALGKVELDGFSLSYGPTKHHGGQFVQLHMVTRDGKLKN